MEPMHKLLYPISREDYALLVAQCQSRCQMCGMQAFLYVDHDHATGYVRGLLCPSCNSWLGNGQVKRDTVEGLCNWYLHLERGEIPPSGTPMEDQTRRFMEALLYLIRENE